MLLKIQIRQSTQLANKSCYDYTPRLIYNAELWGKKKFNVYIINVNQSSKDCSVTNIFIPWAVLIFSFKNQILYKYKSC